MATPDDVLYLEGLLKILETSAHTFSQKLGSPKYINETGKQRFEYDSLDSLHFQTLKAIRLVSLLNGAMHLWKVGHFHEMAIILRCIYESVFDIDFIQEAHETGKPTEHQQKMIDLFRKRTIKTGAELMAEPNKFESVPRKKVRASMGRAAAPFENPERVQRLHEVMEDVFSAYVHGEYPTIMEYYEGGTERFRLTGMFDTKKKHPYLWQYTSALMNCMNAFIIVARNMQLKELADEIQKERKLLEGSKIYKGEI